MLELNSPAPEYEGREQNLGKWVVLYFYPEDDTPGCTKEACGIRDNYDRLSRLATVIGVSADSQESHERFKEKYQLPFELISDPEKKIIKAYGADAGPFVKRITYLIDPTGKIAKIYPKVNPSQHAEELIKDLEAETAG